MIDVTATQNDTLVLIGNYFKDHRESAGLTMTDVSRLSGGAFTQSWVSFLESGQIDPSYLRVAKYASVLRIPLPSFNSSMTEIRFKSQLFDDEPETPVEAPREFQRTVVEEVELPPVLSPSKALAKDAWEMYNDKDGKFDYEDMALVLDLATKFKEHGY